MRTLNFVPITKSRGTLCESLRWIAPRRCLQWVDILEGRLCRWYEETGDVDEHAIGAPLACALPLNETRMVLALGQSLVLYDWDSGTKSTIAELPLAAGTRLNDGGIAPDGSIWIGSMSQSGSPDRGRLWRVQLTGEVETVLESVSTSNGIGWLDDGRMLYVDTDTRRVDSLRRELDGTWFRSTFAATPSPGWPDGLHVDGAGNVWVAMWDGARVLRFDSGGRLVDFVPVPAPRCASVTWAGSAGEMIAVATATWGMAASELTKSPLSGHVLVARLKAPAG